MKRVRTKGNDVRHNQNPFRVSIMLIQSIVLVHITFPVNIKDNTIQCLHEQHLIEIRTSYFLQIKPERELVQGILFTKESVLDSLKRVFVVGVTSYQHAFVLHI